MAYRWRFRHKLFLAHGLVVAIVLMLLGGTLYGLISYKATTRTFDKKLVELTKAEEFRSKIRAVPDLSNPNGWSVPSLIASDDEALLGWYPQVMGVSAAEHETDKLAGQVARFFVQGYSRWEMLFLLPDEDP